MSEFRLKKVVNTYFDILIEEGILEEHVKDFFQDGDYVTIIMLTGKAFSKQIEWLS